MKREIKRTIKEVLNFENGKCIDANDFFTKPLDELTQYRSELQKAINGFREPLFKCYYCKQLIRIRGGKSAPHIRKTEIFHFAHLKDSDDCHIKTNNQFTKEEVDRIKYNGAKESILHQNIKEHIADSLKRNQDTNKGITQIEVERVISDKVDKEWKKPDINAYFKTKRLAIELQLSTTWLDVITRRQHFYREHGIYILWVFNYFNLVDDMRKLTFNDVVYTNNQNAYVFDDEMYERSIAENDLILRCYYKKYYKKGYEIVEEWDNSFIKLSDLTFDERNFRIFYHDSENQKKEIEEKINNQKKLEVKAQNERVLRVNEEKMLKEEQVQARNEKKQYLEDKILDLNSVLDGIKTLQQKNSDKISKSKRVLNIKLGIIGAINEYIDRTVKYLANSSNSNKPFFDNDDLLKSFKAEFGDELSSATETISLKEREQIAITKNLFIIKSIPLITIGDEAYSNIDKSIYWDFIMRNFAQIKLIDKKFVGELFAGSWLRSIRSNSELFQLQISNNYLFLTDFSVKIAELNELFLKNKATIEEKRKIISSSMEQIRVRLETHIKNEIQELEYDLDTYEQLHKRNEYEIELKESELATINSALFKLKTEEYFS